MSIYNPIVTLGLDPEISRLVTQGYGPSEVTIQIVILPAAGGGRSGKRRKEDKEPEDRLIRIRVMDEDGKVMVQEKLIPLNELSKITIKINEKSVVYGNDIYIQITPGTILEGEVQQIKVKAHETK